MVTSFDVLALLRAFAQDPRTITLIALIALNLATGVAAALRTHSFDLGKLGDFYSTRVLPYIICYAAVFVLVGLLGANLPPDVGAVIAQITDTVGAGVAILSLLAAIADNIGQLRAEPPAPTPKP